jgi:hypothetical protein
MPLIRLPPVIIKWQHTHTHINTHFVMDINVMKDVTLYLWGTNDYYAE